MRVPHNTGGGSSTRSPYPYPLSPADGLEGEINPGWAQQTPSFENLQVGHKGIDKGEDLMKGSRLKG